MTRSIIKSGAVLALILSLPAVPALANPDSAASPEADAQKAADPNRMVCKRIEAIGSRLSTKRECKTAKQWEDQMAEERRDLDKLQTGRWKNN
jgi:hypothetical protein